MARSISPSPQTPLVCENCGSTKKVSWYCNMCEGDLCGTCKQNHRSERPLFRNHEIIPRVEALGIKKQEKECTEHPANPYLMVCDTCSNLVCSSCIAGKHRGHNMSELVLAMRKVHEKLRRLSDNFQNNLLVKCREGIEKVNKNGKRNKKWLKLVTAGIEKQRDEMKNMTDKICNNLLETAMEKSHRNKVSIDQMHQKLEKMTLKVRELTDQLKDWETSTNSDKVQLLRRIEEDPDVDIPEVVLLRFSKFLPGNITDEQLSEQIGKLEGLTHDDSTNDPKTTLDSVSQSHCVFPQASKDVSDSSQISEFRKEKATEPDIEVSPSDPKPEEEVKPDCISHNALTDSGISADSLVQTTPLFDTKIEHKHNFDVSSIDSIVPVGADRAWISDWSSREFKLVKITGKVLKTINTEFKFSNFDILPSGKLTATDWYGECVKTISNTGQVSVTIFTHGFRACGVCVCNDKEGIAVVMSGKTCSKLVVYALDTGDVVLSTQYANRLSVIQRVAQNGNGDYCVVHQYRGRVYIISSTGATKATYQGTKKGKLYNSTFGDLCCDRYNQIFVTDADSQSIHVLDQHGQLLTILKLPEDEIRFPKGLDINSDGRLLVGDGNGKLSVVKYHAAE